MEDEIEDLVGDVKYTDSQKSVATTNLYSLDFEDSSSDKFNSSGKETYVIERDDSDDSDKTFQLFNKQSIVDIPNHCVANIAPRQLQCDANVQCEAVIKINKSASPSFHQCSIIAQETYTQTSKTIIELAATETSLRKCTNKTLETQTSLISITENKQVEYKIEFSEANTNNFQFNQLDTNGHYSITCSHFLNNSLDDDSSKLRAPDTDKIDDNKSDISSSDKLFRIIHDESKENVLSEEQNETHYENTSDFDDSSTSDSDIEEDSLMETSPNTNTNHDNNSDISEIPTSLDNDVEDLYKKLAENIGVSSPRRSSDTHEKRFSILTPLTEESVQKQNSKIEVTSDLNNITSTEKEETDKDVIFTNNVGTKIKALLHDEFKIDTFKLPAIATNQCCPDSPHINYLFSITTPHKVINKSGSLPCVNEGQDRWEIATKDLASGESAFIGDRKGIQSLEVQAGIYILINESNRTFSVIPDAAKTRADMLQLPPIKTEGHLKNNRYKNDTQSKTKNDRLHVPASESFQDPISIKKRIKELKLNNKNHRQWTINTSTAECKTSRSSSPVSGYIENSKLADVADKGCEALCVELLRRMRSNSWVEIAETLEDTSTALAKFWGVISENRIADLIRQVSQHVESPRTQVARTACSTLAAILKNTNYTKKPDFYEAVMILLIKTGSFSRPIRRAANVALDDIVCGVDLTHAVTALCIHGVGHKSPLVRCAAARLLVVCCALAGGGRELLRTRPASAASARRYALQALAALLDDKNTETRKYAERLYSMLRPLCNFEAYYLTDVEVELASKQMKKYDRLLLCGPPNEAR